MNMEGVDAVYWINLKRAKDRRKHMEKLLKNVKVPNTRIQAIDGKNKNVRDLVKVEYER